MFCSLAVKLLVGLELALLVKDQHELVADLEGAGVHGVNEIGEFLVGEKNLHTGAAHEVLVDLVHQKMAAEAFQILLILGLCFDLTIAVAY